MEKPIIICSDWRDDLPIPSMKVECVGCKKPVSVCHTTRAGAGDDARAMCLTCALEKMKKQAKKGDTPEFKLTNGQLKELDGRNPEMALFAMFMTMFPEETVAMLERYHKTKKGDHGKA